MPFKQTVANITFNGNSWGYKTMLCGLNTDIEHGGNVYHVQTEDKGIDNPVVITQLFLSGAILSSKKTSYADILKMECLDDVVKDLMKEQHSAMIRELLSGKFSHNKQGDVKDIEQKMASDKKGLDDVILDYLFSNEEKK